ncbi:DEAD/DEAH box helicase [Candidatus Uhrbacteria bacterium]|nr:DEAD/DEAH box helicase [Candidatus Uhrbacteria bacterium]
MNGKELPIWAVMPQVLAPLREGRNVVVTSPTGSGKTTQVPQAILDSGLAYDGMIFAVQSRRVACRAAAVRVAEERGAQLGREIGYIVRYDRKTSEGTQICFVTDGVLMRFLEKDPELRKVSVVILDEFHERRMLSDAALALMRQVQKKRTNLRLVAMSATLDTLAVQKFLDAAVVDSGGEKLFPIEIRQFGRRPLTRMLPEQIATSVRNLCSSGKSGHILVFLPGKALIQDTRQMLTRRAERFPKEFANTVVLPLHAELSEEEQDRVFKPTAERKIILATNVAETSLTIPGVTMVVDSGLERRARYSPHSSITHLGIVPISKASATQRTGRCGREAPGICVRLWSASEHARLEALTPPEIRRTDVGGLVLSLKAVGVNEVGKFQFFEPPSEERLAKAQELLTRLGALDQGGGLTKIGWKMLRLPLPPRQARMVVEARKSRCLKMVSTIASCMLDPSIFARPMGKREWAQDQHRSFAIDDTSDCFSFLQLVREADHFKFSPEWCTRHAINRSALLEAWRLRWHVMRAVHRIDPMHVAPGREPHLPSLREQRAVIRRCIAAGLVDRVARRVAPGRYELCTGAVVDLDQGSVVDAEWIVAGDMRKVGTTKKAPVRISLATMVDLPMMEQLAPTLFRSSREVIERYPLTKTARVRRERRYLNLVLEQEEGLVADGNAGGESGLAKRLAPLSEAVARLTGKTK